jgi:hypothetical protein
MPISFNKEDEEHSTPPKRRMILGKPICFSTAPSPVLIS